MSRALLHYWHTLRYLKPGQIYARLRRHTVRPRIDSGAAPPLRARGGRWVAPAQRRASLESPTRFRLLGQTHDLQLIGWDNAVVDQLWRYNLHYFDDLNATETATRGEWHRTLLARWVRENPPGSGTGWEPYPTSLRIVNWIKWALGGQEVSRELAHSLAVQARWLARRLETHLRGNHLLANAKALIFAGAYFDGPEAQAWLQTGVEVLRHELPEQILSDGGHFELSVMYHALALEDVLDLCNVAAEYAAVEPRLSEVLDGLHHRVPAMRRWLEAMLHPDGEISFFNDCAIGVAPEPAGLNAYAQRLGFAANPGLVREGLTHLADSGYVRLDDAGAVALLDVARVGADYIPGHAHADTLSFELSLFGQRVFVNSGTSMYGISSERLRQRGTAAHNTVVVDQQDSSEVWSGFRVARRARPFDLRLWNDPAMEVACSHDGYRRLRGRPTHSRSWRLTAGALEMVDRVEGEFSTAEARFYLHPRIEIDRSAGEGATLRLPDGRRVSLSVEGAALRYDRTTWHPEFGASVPNHCLVAGFENATVRTRVTWRQTP